MREKKKTITRKHRDEPDETQADSQQMVNEGYDKTFGKPEEEKPAAKNPEGEVAAPVLHGKKRVGKGPKKFEHPTDNNMSREVQPEMDEGKPELDDGEPELEE